MVTMFYGTHELLAGQCKIFDEAFSVTLWKRAISRLHFLILEICTWCRNYVIQYIIDMKMQTFTNRIVNQLTGRFGALSMQKYSSNVVEKCLKLGGEAERGRIISELILKPDELLDISLDEFGNYVVQTAISSSKVRNCSSHFSSCILR